MTRGNETINTNHAKIGTPEDVKKAVLGIVEGVYKRHGEKMAWQAASDAMRILRCRGEAANWDAVSRDKFWKWCNVPKNRQPEKSIPCEWCSNQRFLKHKVSGEVIMIAEPYACFTDLLEMNKIASFCEGYGLKMWITPDTRYHPSQTIGIVVCRKEASFKEDLFRASSGGAVPDIITENRLV